MGRGERIHESLRGRDVPRAELHQIFAGRIGKSWWLDGHHREYTSVAFLIDRAGVVRHVHLGGRLAPGSRDFAVVESRIQALLAER